jgi:hypothetical protein
MRHKTTEAVLSYFNRVRNGESAPLRGDIDPQALKTVLPDVFILEMEDTGGFRFRLAGTRVCSILGQEARGRNFVDYFAPSHRHKMKLAAESVLANRAPLLVDVNGMMEGEQTLTYEMLLLPLRSRPEICDRLFGCIVALETGFHSGAGGRLLTAERLSFMLDGRPPARPVPTVSVAVPQPSDPSFASRILHLKLLQGGRRD